MDMKYVFEVSSSFLVESSGDSEGDSDLRLHDDVDLDEDDAESCCYDVGSKEESIDMDYDHDYSDEDDEECNSYGGHNVGDGKWRGVSLVLACEAMQEKQKQVEEDVSDGMMTEDEKNRLFWENCLAQGY